MSDSNHMVPSTVHGAGAALNMFVKGKRKRKQGVGGLRRQQRTHGSSPFHCLELQAKSEPSLEPLSSAPSHPKKRKPGQF